MIIIGAKGLAKELLTALSWDQNNRDELYFFDNVSEDIPEKIFDKFLVIKNWEDLSLYFLEKDPDFILGVGGPKTRYLLCKKAVDVGGVLSTYISNKAMIGDYGNIIEKGVCILSNATITCDVKIGTGSLINKNVTISHDVEIGIYCEVSPCATVLGRVKVGDYSFIGAGAVILPDIVVGKNCIIGAGAVVTKNVPDNSIVAGIPAKVIKKNEEVEYG